MSEQQAVAKPGKGRAGEADSARDGACDHEKPIY
jgi:hypothetical protein